MNKKVDLANKKSNTSWIFLIGIASITIYFKIEAADPFNTPKMLILLVLGSYFFGSFLNYLRVYRVRGDLNDRIIFGLLSSFLLSLLIATLLSNPVLNGFIGDTQRRNGFLSYLMLVIIFLVTYISFGEASIIRFFIIAVFTGLVLSIYGLLQINGRDFVQWVNPNNSMISTLGNPNFASAMLAVFASIGLFSIFINKVPVYLKIGAGLLVPFSFYCIVKSDSRQGLVTFFFAVLFYLTIFFSLKFKKIRIPIFIVTGGMSALVVLGMLQKGPLTYWLYKDSVSVRGFYWRAGLEMLKDNIFFGVGMDRYGTAFKFYREVEYPLRYGYEITSSNAHNTIIQIFSTAGIFAGIIYISILSYILYSGLRFIKRTSGQQQLAMLSLLSSWMGFQAQSFISIDNIGVSVWGWLLGGAVLGYIKSFKPTVPSADSQKKAQIKNSAHIDLFQPVVSTTSVLIILLVVIPTYKSETDSYLVKSLGNNLTEQNRDNLYKYSKKVIDSKFADPYYKFQAALYMYDGGFKDESKIVIQNLIKKDKINLDFLNGLAYVYTVEKQLDKAIEMHKEVVKYDPWNADNYFDLGSLLVQTGDESSAKRYFSKIISFAPNTEIAEKSQEILNSLDK